MFIFKRNQIIITALVFMVSIAAYLNFTDKKNAVQPTFDDGGQKITQANEKEQMEDDFFTTYEFDNINTLAPDFDSMEDELAEAIEEDQILSSDDQLAPDGLPSDGQEATVVKENVILSLKDRMMAENNEAKSKNNLNNGAEEVVLVNKSHDVNYFIEARMDREQKRAEQIEILSECIGSSTLDKDSKSDAATNLITLQERIEKESAIEALLKAKGFKEVFVRISDDDVDVVINKKNIEEADVAQIEDIVRRKTGYTTSQIKISPLKS